MNKQFENPISLDVKGTSIYDYVKIQIDKYI